MECFPKALLSFEEEKKKKQDLEEQGEQPELQSSKPTKPSASVHFRGQKEKGQQHKKKKRTNFGKQLDDIE